MAVSSNSQALRAIGQALEEVRLDDFDLERFDGGFVVRRHEPSSQEGKSLFGRIRRRLRRGEDPLELRYTMEDIETLDEKGKAQRTGEIGIPDFYSLSQFLRTVGGYVDQRRARLIAIFRRGLMLTIEYVKTDGQLVTEEHTVASFYNSFVQMYRHRREVPPPRGTP